MTEPEGNLIAAAIEGDRDALTALLMVYGPHLRQHLHVNRIWQGALDVEDILQVTYLEAFLRIGQLVSREPVALLAWLKTIAENNLRDAIRGLSRDKRGDPRKRIRQRTPEESTVQLLEKVACKSTTVGRVAQKKERLEALHRAIARLPETYRTVIESYDLNGDSPAEVAAKLGRSIGAIHMLRARAHERLRDLLGTDSKFFTTSA